jgi:hypothetical protein
MQPNLACNMMGCMHILPPSVAAIALKILPMISPIRLSPPLLTGCVVLCVIATLFAGVGSPRGSCTTTSALPCTPVAPACSVPYLAR